MIAMADITPSLAEKGYALVPNVLNSEGVKGLISLLDPSEH